MVIVQGPYLYNKIIIFSIIICNLTSLLSIPLKDAKRYSHVSCIIINVHCAYNYKIIIIPLAMHCAMIL